jgi:hypothetical protein
MAEKDSITSGNGKSVKNLCLTIDEWDALHTLADQQRALSDALFLAVDNDIREDSLSTIRPGGRSRTKHNQPGEREPAPVKPKWGEPGKFQTLPCNAHLEEKGKTEKWSCWEA